MSNGSPLKLVDSRADLARNTAAFLRKLADAADDGELFAVTCLTEYADGSYSTGGTGTMSRLQTVGALFEAAVKRMGVFDT